MNRDGAIRLMLTEDGEGDEGSNWFISFLWRSGGVFVAKRFEERRPRLVFLTPVDKFNQRKSHIVKCFMEEIRVKTWKKALV